MMIEADPLEKLRTRTSEKWSAFPDDVLPLFVAEMDYPLAEPIAEALIAAVRRSDTGYVGADDRVQRAFAQYAGEAWGWRVDPAGIRTTTDVSVVIVESLRRAIRPGDRVIITPPVYPPFFELIPEAGGVVEQVPLLFAEEDGWSLDLPGIERAFASGARAFLLCNPHNPVGLVHNPDDLAAVAELAARYDAVVVSDEVHAPLTHSDATFTPFLSVSDAAREHGIAAHSGSKAFNITGLKCAVFVTQSDRMADLLAPLPAEVQVRTGIFGRIATVAAYRDSRDWLTQALAAIESNRAMLGRLLERYLTEVRYREPQAGYLAWLDFRELGWGDDPSLLALEKGRVALMAGPHFGTQGVGFVRLNFACSPSVLTEAVLRLAAVAT
ncbi:MAG: MalY/PatB family protein [Actinomycetales bacterium]